MTGKFLTVLDVRQPKEGEPWMLDNPLVFESELAGTVIVPAGFATDFASVPRLPVAYILFGDVVHAPAVVHDYLYASKEIRRDLADAVFEEAMQACGVSWWKRKFMWAAVRIFGGFVRKYT